MAENDAISRLYEVVLARRADPQPGSYTNYLFDSGLNKILKKVGEECAETIIAAKDGGREPIVAECADLIYHLLVMLAACGIDADEVMRELDARAKKTGNLKEMKKVDKDT